MITAFAALASLFALLSGIAAVGNGEHFKFNVTDIWQGQRNAVLYVWVTCSSIFSLGHFAQLTSYVVSYRLGYRVPDDKPWMILHAAVAVLLISAHLYILRTLQEGGLSKYLWGPNRVQ